MKKYLANIIVKYLEFRLAKPRHNWGTQEIITAQFIVVMDAIGIIVIYFLLKAI